MAHQEFKDCPASSLCERCGSATFRAGHSNSPPKPGTTPLGLEEAHRELRISPAEFDEVAAELGRTLDFFKVPKREKAEVLAAFAAHKDEVTAGYVENPKRGEAPGTFLLISPSNGSLPRTKVRAE